MFMYFNCIYIFIFISRLYIGVLVKSGSLGALNFFSFAYVFMIWNHIYIYAVHSSISVVCFCFCYCRSGCCCCCCFSPIFSLLFSSPYSFSLSCVLHKKKRRRRREENNGETRGSSSYTRRSIRMSRAHSGKSIIIVISLYNYIIYVLEIK